MKTAFSSIIAMCALPCVLQTAYPLPNTTTNQEDSAVALKTEDFESGKKEMAVVAAGSLERFLQDLNQRKDWDYACHNGQPGPDSAYLFKWVTRTTCELERRGYYFDPAGQLHQPGIVVPLR